MSRTSEISVVIPCYNDGHFLTDSLGSVFAQTRTPTEILIVDDGSSDPNTLNVLRKISEQQVRVIHQENRGLAGARNTGIRNVRSKYVYFLDSDDKMYPECLARLADLMEQNEDAVAAASRIQIWGGPADGTVWCEPCNPYVILVANQLCAGIMLRRRAVQRYNLWYDESMRLGYEDWELNIRLAKTGKPILFCPEPLYQYRIRGNSLLGTARSRHLEILSYIRQKHRELYEPGTLLPLKRSNTPALSIYCSPENLFGLREWLSRQTFQDCVVVTNPNDSISQDTPYRLHYTDMDDLQRLPFEAMESALVALETNPTAKHCVLGLKNNALSWFANGGRFSSSRYTPRAIAIITRRTDAGMSMQEILNNCELLVEFHDQKPEIKGFFDHTRLEFSGRTVLSQRNLSRLRRSLSLFGRTLFGSYFQQACVRLYDAIYGMLVSEKSLEVRHKLQVYVGESAERTISRVFYGLFLTTPPTIEDTLEWKNSRSPSSSVAPLFLAPTDRDIINILIATSWLNEGGVEQEIFDLCRHLEASRFHVFIATTRPSSHPWDHLARELGANVYHLADILKASSIRNGLLHLVLNRHIDCVHIVHSREAYESLTLLKRIAPWLQVTDRNVVTEPGGGFPKISAKVGKNLVDIRTVGHQRLADDMCKEYRLPQHSLRVIYAGTDFDRIRKYSPPKPGLLHEMCNISPDTPIVIFVGRFDPQKRPEIFVRSAVKILDLDSGCKAHFAMVGEGELKASVEKVVCRYNLKRRIHLLGAHPDAISLIADSTLLMMPSAYEGLALVSYEAMALGIPQIFANVNGQAELITPETGILIDNGRGEETRYAKACLDLLADPDRRARMAAAGKQRIKNHFTAENAVKQYAEIFEQMAELSRKRAAEIPHLRPPHINPLHELY